MQYLQNTALGFPIFYNIWSLSFLIRSSISFWCAFGFLTQARTFDSPHMEGAAQWGLPLNWLANVCLNMEALYCSQAHQVSLDWSNCINSLKLVGNFLSLLFLGYLAGLNEQMKAVRKRNETSVIDQIGEDLLTWVNWILFASRPLSFWKLKCFEKPKIVVANRAHRSTLAICLVWEPIIRNSSFLKE